MRNEATICRINSIGCSYCTCPWSTSCCYISFTFGSCGIFFITDTWLKWCNDNCWFSAILLEHFLFLCWGKDTYVWIDLVSCCLLNNVIAFFEVFNLILSWDFDHCRFWWYYHCRFFMRNEATICRIDCVGGSYCTCTWSTSCCYISFTFGFCGIFLITDTWLKRCNENLSLGTILFEDFLFLCWSKSTCTGIDHVSYGLLNNIIAFFEVFDLILSWNFDHCRFWWDYFCWFFMRNEATICRINRVGCSDCSSSWSTSYCYISFTFSFCGVFFITNNWLKWCNHNCWFSAVSLEDFCCLCWSQVTCTCIDLVAGCLLNNVITFFEIFNLILSWDLDHCRFWWDYFWWFFMWNEASVYRINSISGSDRSSAWSTSCCYISFTFSSCGVFFITDTWLDWRNNNLSFGAIFLENFLFLCWSKTTCTCIDFVSCSLLNNVIAVF